MKSKYDFAMMLADYASNTNNSMVDRATAYQLLLNVCKKLKIDLKYVSDSFTDIKNYLSKIK